MSLKLIRALLFQGKKIFRNASQNPFNRCIVYLFGIQALKKRKGIDDMQNLHGREFVGIKAFGIHIISQLIMQECLT